MPNPAWTLQRVIPLALATLLTACGTLPGRSEPAPRGLDFGLTEYDPAFRNRLADELEATPPDSATREFVRDSIRLRDQVRALGE